MPELPEIEHLSRTLEPTLLAAAVLDVDIRRRDVVHWGDANSRRRIVKADLLAGTRVEKLIRHGKNLAIVGEDGRVVCAHLGMSGHMQIMRAGTRFTRSDHVHCVWRLRSARGAALRLIFRDPRRFGGLWMYSSVDALSQERFDHLGPDALSITPAQLQAALRPGNRSIKAALLDQRGVAGIGNIYADESLFLARIHPGSRAGALPREDVHSLTRAIKRVLRAAINAGGSTIRDYADGNGKAGWFADVHQVYGRAGHLCACCGEPLRTAAIAQRTTVFCPKCQRLVK